MTAFNEKITEQQTSLATDITVLDAQIGEFEKAAERTGDQYIAQAEMYETRRSQQDQLDQRVAGLVMDTNINIASFESSAGVYATSV